MNNKTLYISIFSILVFGLLAYFWIYAKPKNSSTGRELAPITTPPLTSTIPEPAAPSEQVVPQNVKEISIEGNEFAYIPATVEVSKGDTVKLTFKNTGKYPHDLFIESLNVRTKVIKQDETDSVEFTLNDVGEFSFYCSVPGHKEKGMTGTLVVK